MLVCEGYGIGSPARSTERDLDERGLPTSAGQLRLRHSEVYLLPLISFSFLESRNDSNCQEIRG